MIDIKNVLEQMENEDIVGERNDKNFLKQLLKFSILLLQYLTVDMQRDIEICREVVKIRG